MTKMEILDRLVKDGAISLQEALVLLETETKIVTVEKIIEKQVDKKSPFTNPLQPYSPLSPYRDPNQPSWFERQNPITVTLSRMM